MTLPILKSMPATKAPAAGVPPAAGAVLALNLPKTSFANRIMPMLNAVAARILPPLVMLVLILAAWQFLCSRPGATLPPPSKIWTEAYDLIVDPFFVAWPQDI